MDFNIPDMPTPRPTSILLVSFGLGFHFVGKMTHDEINNWLATITFVCGLISYIYRARRTIKNHRSTVDKNKGNNPKT